MGIKLLVLLGLLVGVLYCLHILAQDYQAITAPKLLKLLFKRDTSSINKNTVSSDEVKFIFKTLNLQKKKPVIFEEPTVRWRKILQYDHIQCVRFLYCDLGAQPPGDAWRRGFIYMLSLNAKDEDKEALEVFKKAYFRGKLEDCKRKYTTCPFQISLLFDLLRYILINKT